MRKKEIIRKPISMRDMVEKTIAELKGSGKTLAESGGLQFEWSYPDTPTIEYKLLVKEKPEGIK